jgi:hypothetical protein
MNTSGHPPNESKKRRCKSSLIMLAFAFLLVSCPALLAQLPEWTTPVTINTDMFYKLAYPAMAIGHDGSIFVVWQHYSERPYDILAQIYFTSYGGQSWSTELALTDSGGTAWTPDIAVDTLGLPHIVWEDYTSSEIYHRWFDGVRWSEPVNVSQTSGASFYPQVVIDKQNRIHVVWHDNTTGRYSVYYREYDGSQWSALKVISDSLFDAGDPRIAVDSQNNLHVVFDCYTGPPPYNNYDIFYRKCTGGVWSTLERLSTDTLESVYADVATNQSCEPMVVWQQSLGFTTGPVVIQSYVTRFDGFTWSNPESISGTSQSLAPRITMDTRGGAHAVWEVFDQSTRTSSILYSHLNFDKWAVPSILSDPIDHAGGPVIKTDSLGLSHVVFVTSDNRIWYAHRMSTDAVAPTGGQVAEEIVLEQNYPNPFNPTTVIRYGLPHDAKVVLKVCDILGREVRSLPIGYQPAGEHSLVFDGSNLSSGTYYYQIRTDQFTRMRKMILLR